jgi:hypothetical protein
VRVLSCRQRREVHVSGRFRKTVKTVKNGKKRSENGAKTVEKRWETVRGQLARTGSVLRREAKVLLVEFSKSGGGSAKDREGTIEGGWPNMEELFCAEASNAGSRILEFQRESSTGLWDAATVQPSLRVIHLIGICSTNSTAARPSTKAASTSTEG